MHTSIKNSFSFSHIPFSKRGGLIFLFLFFFLLPVSIFIPDTKTTRNGGEGLIALHRAFAENHSTPLPPIPSSPLVKNPLSAQKTSVVRDASTAFSSGQKTLGNEIYGACGFAPSTWSWCIVGWYYSLIYSPSSGLLGVAGSVMDTMVAFSISKDVLNASFAQKGWKSTRDLANMFFIFILLFIAIATILQLSSYGAKALLAKLIIFALLINFSLFITRVIIDSGNITAMFFYDAITVPPSTTVPKGVAIPGVEIKSLSAGIVAKVHPEAIIGTKTFESWTRENKNVGTFFLILLAGTAVNLVMAWALITIAFLFVARVAVLWFLMAVAPLAFAAMILPQTEKLARKWWGELFSKTFCITVFMFFLWLILILLSESFIEKMFGGATSQLGTIEIITVIILNFAVIIVLITMAKKITEKMCGEIEGVSLSIGSKLAGVAGLALGGGVGMLARNTLGRGAAALARSEKFEKWSQNSMLGRGLRKTAVGVAGSSLDLRGMPFAGKGGFGRATGEGGFTAGVAGSTKKKEAYGKTFANDATKMVYAQNLQKGVSIRGRMFNLRSRREAGRNIEENIHKPKIGEYGATIRQNEEGIARAQKYLSNPGVSGDSAAKKYNEEKVLRLQKQNTELLGYVRKGQKAEGREQGEMSVKLAKILANSEKGGGNTGSESGAPKKKE